MTAQDELFVFNGIDGSCGDYLLSPMDTEAVVGLAQGRKIDEVQQEAALRHESMLRDHFAPREDVDPKSIAQSGWGVVFAHDADPAVREALQPLLDHRKAEAASINPDRYREFWGAHAYRPKERKPAFLSRHKAPTSGPVDPDRMPYYLLIVGSPEKISCEFQAQLDLQYAVGRLHFDTLEEYDNYARSVIASERGEVAVARRLGMWGPRHDRATEMSSDGLIAGLDRYVRDKAPDWEVDVRVDAQGTKTELAKMLGGPETPAVLLTGSHGVGFPHGDPRQIPHQGALLCQEWAGRRGRVPPEVYFSGEDLGESARLAGLIAFLFACYGGGTPKHDAFFHAKGKRREIAPHAFFAGLPTRMLGHPHGGALAAVAHVERAWGCSFYEPKSGHQIAVFESFMKRLLDGHPVGSALDCFGNRYGELSSGLLEKLEELEYGGHISPTEIANDWTANNDARNYVVLGDPAVRVPVVDKEQAKERPTLDLGTPGARSGPSMAAAPEAASVAASEARASARANAAPPANAGSESTGSEATGSESGALESFGLFSKDPDDSSDDAKSSGLGQSLRSFASRLGSKISDAITDMSTLDVKTYVVSNADDMTVHRGKVEGAQLRAYTRINLDGDTTACLPQRDGEIDQTILEMHMRMVEQAQRTRVELLETLVRAATSLMSVGK
ncbi:MAG: hypothetical protein AAGF11_29705 [Myxococcota bacterium]